MAGLLTVLETLFGEINIPAPTMVPTIIQTPEKYDVLLAKRLLVLITRLLVLITRLLVLITRLLANNPSAG